MRPTSLEGHGKRGGSFNPPAMWLLVATWDEATVPHTEQTKNGLESPILRVL